MFKEGPHVLRGFGDAVNAFDFFGGHAGVFVRHHVDGLQQDIHGQAPPAHLEELFIPLPPLQRGRGDARRI